MTVTDAPVLPNSVKPIKPTAIDPLEEHKRIVAYFRYDHLSERLQGFSKPFSVQASKILRAAKANELDPGESLVALRKLLEAKDACVRAAL